MDKGLEAGMVWGRGKKMEEALLTQIPPTTLLSLFLFDRSENSFSSSDFQLF